jgi:hypothetical protein
MVKMLSDNYEKELVSQRKKHKMNQDCTLQSELSQCDVESALHLDCVLNNVTILCLF